MFVLIPPKVKVCKTVEGCLEQELEPQFVLSLKVIVWFIYLVSSCGQKTVVSFCKHGHHSQHLSVD